MKGKKLILFYIILLILITTLTFTPVQPVISSMESSWAKITPTIDGKLDEGEWVDATHLSFYHTEPSPGHNPDYVHIYIKNTNSKLYLLFDDLPDDTLEADDHLWIYFDTNLDGIIDENLTMFLDRNHDPGYALPGNSFAEWNIGFDTSHNKEIEHSIMEAAINITFDSIYDGSSSAVDLNNTIPVGTENNTIKIFFSAAYYLCGWEIPEDGAPNLVNTYGTLRFVTRVPIKPYIIVLIIIGDIVLITAIIGGTFIIIKRRKD
ncbi:MAG: hypothetical protein FK731_02045 [Asgard group archaeon]|nr:hypothetical protein [Asgard group archaeon]